MIYHMHYIYICLFIQEKDQVFIYFNRYTSILDTTVSPPGYHHVARDRNYEQKNYVFDTIDDLDSYW